MWLFSTLEINPRGKYFMSVFAELIKRYSFSNVPNVIEAIRKNEGVILGQGSYTHNEHGNVHAELGIYNDGLVGDTRADTDVSEALLDDVLSWLKKDYSYEYPADIRKQYVSKIYVQLNKSINTVNPKLEKFQKALDKKTPYVGSLSFQVEGIQFASEQTGPFAPPHFRIERMAKTPYDRNRYYSFAGLKTSDHLEMINLFEETLR